MNSKKGFMLGEYTLKVVIAVLCLLLLFFLLFKLYFNSVDQRNLGLAEASLNELVEKMDEAKENGNAGVIILNPTQSPSITGKIEKLWAISAWPIEENRKPTKCIKNCVCICPNPPNFKRFTSLTSSSELFLKECNSLGVCKDFDEEIKVSNPGFLKFEWQIPIENPPVNIQIKYEDNKFTITKNE